MYEWSRVPIYWSEFGVSIFYFSHSGRWIRKSHCSFNCISLMANDVDHLFTCLFFFLYHLNILFDEMPHHGFQFSSVAQSCPTLCDPMNCSTPGLPVHHQLPEFTQTHIHPVSDAIQPSHPLSSPSPPSPNPSQHQSLFQWVNSSHEVAKLLEFQLWHHSFQRRNSQVLEWYGS